VDYCKKYYTLKKQILKSTQGLETFTWADRNASIDIGSAEDNYSWEQAVDLVHKGYNKFSPTMANMFLDFVEQKRIDVPAQDGKRGGAYCSSAYGSGPFQLLNFTHSARDVATLAHESGHAVHFVLSYPQGILQFHPPLTLAETASIFGEMIVFRDLLEKTPSDEDRLAMIMSKVDDIINSVVRQCSFDKYEEKFHTMRAKGTVTPEEMSKAWRESMEEYYGAEGEVFDSYEDTSSLSLYVSHFHNVPFVSIVLRRCVVCLCLCFLLDAPLAAETNVCNARYVFRFAVRVRVRVWRSFGRLALRRVHEATGRIRGEVARPPARGWHEGFRRSRRAVWLGRGVADVLVRRVARPPRWFNG
jgi:oligoendopeptidase F